MAVGNAWSTNIERNRARPLAFGGTETAHKSSEPAAVTRRNASAGVKVVRGKHWRWGDQDGGAGKVGEILKDGRAVPDGWCQVRWEDGNVNDYRVGSNGKYDLVLQSGKPAEVKKDARPPADEKCVEQLLEMGFTRSACVHALQVGGNNLTAAVDWMSDPANEALMLQFAEQDVSSAPKEGDAGSSDQERSWNSSSMMEDTVETGSGSILSPSCPLTTSCPFIEVELLSSSDMCIGLQSAEGHVLAVFSPDGQMSLAGDAACGYEISECTTKPKRFAGTLEGIEVTVGMKVMLADGFQECGDAASGPLQEGVEGVIVEASREPGGRVRASATLDSERRWWYDRKALALSAPPISSKAVVSDSAEFGNGDRVAVGIVVGLGGEPTGEVRVVKNGCVVVRSCQVTRPSAAKPPDAGKAAQESIALTPLIWVDSEDPHECVRIACGGRSTAGAFVLRDCHPAILSARSLGILFGAAGALLDSRPPPRILTVQKSDDKEPVAAADWTDAVRQVCAICGDLCDRVPPGLVEPRDTPGAAEPCWPFSSYCAMAALMSVQNVNEGAVSGELLERAFKATCQPELRAAFRELLSVSEGQAKAPESRDALLKQRAMIVARLSGLMLSVLPMLSFASAEDDPPFLAGSKWPPTLLLQHVARLLLKANKDPVVRKLLGRVNKPANDRPAVSLDRFRAHTSSATAENSVFGQVHAQIGRSHGGRLFGDRWWRVSLQGESVSDGGGAFRDSLSTIAAELMSDATPLFIEAGGAAWGRCVVPNPSCHETALYEFVGQLMGACLHSGERLALTLPPFVWRKLAGHPVGWEDFAAFEPELASLYDRIERNEFPRADGSGSESYPAEVFEDCIALDFTLSLGVPMRTVELVPGGARVSVTLENRAEFVRLARGARMRAYDAQLRAMRVGLAAYCPEAVLALWSSFELESAVCGEPDIPLDQFKDSTRFQGPPLPPLPTPFPPPPPPPTHSTPPRPQAQTHVICLCLRLSLSCPVWPMPSSWLASLVAAGAGGFGRRPTVESRSEVCGRRAGRARPWRVCRAAAKVFEALCFCTDVGWGGGRRRAAKDDVPVVLRAAHNASAQPVSPPRPGTLLPHHSQSALGASLASSLPRPCSPARTRPNRPRRSNLLSLTGLCSARACPTHRPGMRVVALAVMQAAAAVFVLVFGGGPWLPLAVQGGAVGRLACVVARGQAGRWPASVVGGR